MALIDGNWAERAKICPADKQLFSFESPETSGVLILLDFPTFLPKYICTQVYPSFVILLFLGNKNQEQLYLHQVCTQQGIGKHGQQWNL